MKLSNQEKELGRLALRVVNDAGGSVSFKRYDELMYPVVYFSPFNWIDGWGLGRKAWKQNNDKLCAFAAVAMGLLRQTEKGYEAQ